MGERVPSRLDASLVKFVRIDAATSAAIAKIPDVPDAAALGGISVDTMKAWR